MAAGVAIDRIVRRSVLLEFELPSYRINAVQSRQELDSCRRRS